MDRAARLLFCSFLVAVASACAPVSVSHYQTAKPLGRGNVQFGGGVHFQKAGEYGTDRDQAEGQNIQEHHASNLPVDAEFHYGLTDRLEIYSQIYFTGGKVGVRQNLLNGDHLKVCVGGTVGYFTGSAKAEFGSPVTSTASIQIAGTYFDFPLTVSLHANDYFAVYGGALVTRFDATAKFVEKDGAGNVTDRYSRSAGYFQPGAFVGINIGHSIQLSPGFTVYYEDSEYPLENLKGKSALYGYPWIGLTIATGQNPRRTTPPMDTPPPPPAPPQ